MNTRGKTQPGTSRMHALENILPPLKALNEFVNSEHLSASFQICISDALSKFRQTSCSTREGAQPGSECRMLAGAWDPDAQLSERI